MTAAAGAVDFFTLEASEYVERLDTLLAAGERDAPDVDGLARTARALRGAATMARHTALADLASAIETVTGSLRDAPGGWSPATRDALVAAVDAYKALLRVARQWDASADATAAARAAELRAIASAATAARRPAPIVSIARLFRDGDAQPIVHRNDQPPITADQRFRQAAVPLASTLRRLVGEARQAGDDGARRAVGDDLRAALRDLGELAESYDIRAVANFAQAREDALARLDERTLDVVDSAAQALVESAGPTWARNTPPAAIAAVAPVEPTPAPNGAPAPPAERVPTPPSGQALVALLESSITGLHRLGAESSAGLMPPAEPPEREATRPRVDSGDVVSIDALLYRGRPALDRARELAARLRPSRAPDPALLAELYDLLDLAATDEHEPAPRSA